MSSGVHSQLIERPLSCPCGVDDDAAPGVYDPEESLSSHSLECRGCGAFHEMEFGE